MSTTGASFAPAITASGGVGCMPYNLPAHGILSIYGAEPTELSHEAFFQPSCLPQPQPAILVTGGLAADDSLTIDDLGSTQFVDARDPFQASIFPQCYALAATTVLAYVLFLMLLIVPRSFLDGGVVVLGRRGFTNGPSHGLSIGGRPWLQKVAALSVTISLTIATVDTFRVAEHQYSQGTQNAAELQREVLGGLQLKVIQLVSDTFLWLAQAQTLIRLFPRQREKIIIKWTAFCLILLDVIFGALNSFWFVGIGSTSRPLGFTDPIGALSYLFQLSLGVLYAAWVIYYSLMKKRYAFYHPLMKNICIMAALSIISIFVPVVFFVLDIAKPEFTGWGEYVRWVGAAAASVVVWEWVERIEALEREEKKDGILGREVFDGDEMMDNAHSDLHSWRQHKKKSRKFSKGGSDGGEGGAGNPTTSSGMPSKTWPAMSSIANRHTNTASSTAVTGTAGPSELRTTSKAKQNKGRFLQAPFWPSRPAPAVTPVSRTETASADSTVYAVRYQSSAETSSRNAHDRIPERPFSRSEATSSPVGISTTDRLEDTPSPENTTSNNNNNTNAAHQPTETVAEEPEAAGSSNWFASKRLGLFRAVSRGPPAEVLPHTMPRPTKSKRNHEGTGRWDVRGRWEDFSSNHAEKVLERMRGTPDTENLPVTVIPAPPRPGAALAQLLEENEREAAAEANTSRVARHPASPIQLTPLPARTHNVGGSARPVPPPSAGGSQPRSPGLVESRTATSPTSRRPVVRYESLPSLPSNGIQRDGAAGGEDHRQRRPTPQSPLPPPPPPK